MKELTIKIVDRGTPYIDADGVSHTSQPGHMWYELNDGNQTYSFGFAPVESGRPQGGRRQHRHRDIL